MLGAGYLRRWWRWLRPGGSPLVRREDRLEARILLGAVLLCLAAIPIAVWIGSATFARQLPVAREEMRERHPATAVTLSDAPPALTGLAVEPTEQVPGRWRLPDGNVRVGTLGVMPGTEAGTRVPIWLDRDGDLVDPPMTPEDVVTGACSLGIVVWFAWTLLLAATVWLVRLVLDRRRARQWALEWERFGHRPQRS